MDIKNIKLLVKLMVDNDLSELDMADGDSKIHLKRGVGGVPMVMPPSRVTLSAPNFSQESPLPVA
jgi:hypothetical protein